MTPADRDSVSAEDITLRYIESLESRCKRLEKREWIWISAGLVSIGVNIVQFVSNIGM